jgi:predicted DNA-binding transcriptional regulator AlpA
VPELVSESGFFDAGAVGAACDGEAFAIFGRHSAARSCAAIFKAVAENRFPPPVPLAPGCRAVGWPESDIAAHQKRCIALRNKTKPKPKPKPKRSRLIARRANGS